MTHSIGHFTSCSQGQRLVQRFGDCDMTQLPQIDQAALLAILGQYIYQNEAFADSYANRILLVECANDAIHTDDDETTDLIQAAIEILEGITQAEALAVISFLAQ